MATETIRGATVAAGKGWLRTYPPLVTMVVALFIGVAVLPSALNLPQSNPSTVLEYAPVPPDDSTPQTSGEGSISSLGLGTSGGLTTGTREFELPDKVSGIIRKPKVLDCIRQGKELKQTDDPNSPPCVAFFDGDNGGATWQGVTKDEVLVVMYHASGYISDQEREGSDSSIGEQSPPGGTYCDIEVEDGGNNFCSDPTTGEEHSVVVASKALFRFFNERFQTYNRNVHLVIYWASCGIPCPASARRSHASEIWETYKPYAVIDKAFFGGNNQAFAEAVARRKISIYGSYGFLPNKFYRENAPYFWSFFPDIEHWADGYVSYVCQKVAGTPVVSSQGLDKDGNPIQGQKRRYALMWSTDSSYPGLQHFKNLAEPALKECLAKHGEEIVQRVTFPYAGYARDFDDPKQQKYGVDNVALMRDAKVNTILWLGGMETKTGFAAAGRQFFPEIVVAGDQVMDEIINAREQQQDFWRNARAVTKLLREDDFSRVPGRRAFRYSEPDGRQIHEYYANLYYRDFFTMFKAIQVAGPKLTPQAVDAGQHAIPRIKSTDAFVATCYYDPNDFSCVKDSHIAWWDPEAPDPNGEAGRGCWRMVDEGNRYLAWGWDKLGLEAFVNGANDPCNGVKGGVTNR